MSISNRQNVKAEDVKKLLLNTYSRLYRGDITEARAYKETYILNSILRAIEVTDLENRLQRIEELLKRDSEF